MENLFVKKNQNYKIDEKEALEEIEKIEEEFGSLDDDGKTVFLDSIRRGNLEFNGEDLLYKLEKPVGDCQLITFTMLTADQLLDLSDLEVVSLNGKTSVMDVKPKKQLIQKTYRMLNKVCKIEASITSKMKKVDLEFCMVVTNFLS